jgi:hypothetical protein
MKMLANSTKEAFQLIALRYFFDTLPFTMHVAQASLIAEPLLRALDFEPAIRDLFGEFLMADRPYACALFYSSDPHLRSLAQRLIEKIDPMYFTLDFFSVLLAQITELLPYQHTFNEYFALFDSVISAQTSVRQLAVEGQWIDLFTTFLTHDISEYLQTHPTVTPLYFYQSATLTGLLQLIAHLSPSDVILDSILQDEFFIHVLASRTEISAFTAFLQSFSVIDRIRDFVSAFSIRAGIRAPYFRLIPFLFDFFRINAFSLISELRLKAAEQPANDFSLASALLCYLFGHPDFGDDLLARPDAWLDHLLTSEVDDARGLTQHIVTLLIPHEAFSRLPEMRLGPFANFVGTVRFVAKPVDDTMLSRARTVLSFLKSISSSVLDRISSRPSTLRSPVAEFVSLIHLLADIVSENASPFFLGIFPRILPIGFLFLTDFKLIPVLDIVGYLIEHDSEAVTPELVMGCCDQIWANSSPRSPLAGMRVLNLPINLWNTSCYPPFPYSPIVSEQRFPWSSVLSHSIPMQRVGGSSKTLSRLLWANCSELLFLLDVIE